MPQQYYSVDQVAELLDLHVRTVRGYVRDGRLKATRIGKQYRIAREDLEAFTGRPAPSSSPSSGPERRQAEASVIVRIDAIGPEATMRLTNTVMAAIAHGQDGGERLRVETVYDEERAVLKVIILGGLDSTAELLKIVNALIEQPE
ncbi:helix-turn-helix domain-containing protein [Streptomyces scopuliridis]|uniref:Helix-turn-helix domain-containing protein n=1 Tax=Streptomyces scopuliridis TaxID=452529 RepID=A0ACD4ZQV9_9ACTN|nr:helix-turn-helix domain-containing protein [Streptomyces scopuliridis]WSB36366.1 helix-turn-helix domain-containing protein [Streptomyces scopuliridis]WSC00663.1 helix-turn-helix domain-containing protein [Streptomyces scopuliridis]WSC05726.1 helix-turn-helix domain-containing protein [Streptomyces scopuliridis]